MTFSRLYGFKISENARKLLESFKSLLFFLQLELLFYLELELLFYLELEFQLIENKRKTYSTIKFSCEFYSMYHEKHAFSRNMTIARNNAER